MSIFRDFVCDCGHEVTVEFGFKADNGEAGEVTILAAFTDDGVDITLTDAEAERFEAEVAGEVAFEDDVDPSAWRAFA